ncbi:tRNA(1-methyladenosine) methyltransferase, subunit GCD14, partial [Trachipleistophora hominis]
VYSLWLPSMIKDGQPVILYFSPSNIKLIHKDSSTTLNTSAGPLKHTSIDRYNTIIHLKNGQVTILRPTHYLISNTACSTQVIFDYDASFVCFVMGLKSTDVLFEAGFGSGVLTGSLARFVRLVYSCERIVDRIRNVGKNVIVYEGDCNDLIVDVNEKDYLDKDDGNLNEVESLQMNDDDELNKDDQHVVERIDEQNRMHHAHTDVGQDTDGGSEKMVESLHRKNCRISTKNVINKMVDGIVLDMPEPWLVIPTLKAILKRNKTMCVFVISIQQVTKTLRAMRTFKNIRVYENVGREYSMKKSCGRRVCELKDNQYMHTGYLIFGTK